MVLGVSASSKRLRLVLGFWGFGTHGVPAQQWGLEGENEQVEDQLEDVE